MVIPFEYTHLLPPHPPKSPKDSATATTHQALGAWQPTALSNTCVQHAPGPILSTLARPQTQHGMAGPPPHHPTDASLATEGTKLPTPVNYTRLSTVIHGHPDHDYLVAGFRDGFLIDFQGPQQSLLSNNSVSAKNNPSAVSQKITIEANLGRIAGPFSDPPFPVFKSSPLALREKAEPGKYRLLHNLSFPYDESAVNTNIPRLSATVQYANISQAISYIQEAGQHAWLAKCDIADAFRIIPLHPSQYHLMGFYWDGYWYDRCLPMGCSQSCQIFEKFSSAIQWALHKKFSIQSIVKVLDDFLFISKSKSSCRRALFTFQEVSKYIGIPLAPHKTLGPVNQLTFLGIELDTIQMEARLPIDKLTKYSSHVAQLLQKNKITLRDLKSVIGMLQFATSVVNGGRAFIRRLHDLTMQASQPHHFIRLTSDAKSDLQIWLSFLSSFNGKSFIWQQHIVNSPAIHLCSDASKIGFGATYGSSWIAGTWPPSWQGHHITILELYPIFITISMFARHLKNSKVIFHCDNQAVVTILNKQTSKDKFIMAIIRPLILILLNNSISLTAKHIPGLNNVLCDCLSRQKASSEMLLQYGMKPLPSPIPCHLLPENFSIK